MPAYRYHLYDLTTYSDEEIQGEIILRASLLLLKYIFRPELEQRLRDILRLLQAVSEPRTGLEYLEMALRYIASSTDRISEAELQQLVIEVIEEGGTLMPTLVEQWLEQGRQEGLAKGREEGREAMLDLLRRFLARRFKVALDQFDKELQDMSLSDIHQLSDVAFEAESLAEFEAALYQAKLGGNDQNEA